MIGRRNAPPEPPVSKPKSFDDFDLRLGDVMRGERATMGKSLLDVQRDLKIKAIYIAAIENADPAAFETQGFVAGYVRSYARYLGLDPEWAYTRFCQEGDFVTAHGMSPSASANRLGAGKKLAKKVTDPYTDPNATFIPKGEAVWSRLEPGAIGSSLVLIMLISMIGYGGWSVFQAIQKVQLAPVEQAPGVTSDVSAFETRGAIVTATNEYSGFDTPPSIDALDRIYRPEALEVPVLIARDGPIAALDPALVGTLAPVLTTPELVSVAPDLQEPPVDALPPAIQVVADNIAEVVIFAVRPSWIRVQAVDGTVIFEKILDAGERYVLPKTEEPPLLRAGNAGSVYFVVNGLNYGPAGDGPSVVKNVPLAADALTSTYQTADLTKDNDLARFVEVAQSQAGGSN
ncbi:MAG: helix-turn-helix domain-containing protein [Paracoccaceae bacterium]